MTLETNLQDLATRMGTEAKALRTLLNGNQVDLSGLSFGTKSNLVSSLNELALSIANATGINDAVTATNSSWSSQRTVDAINGAVSALVGGAPTALDTLKELADALAADQTSVATILTALDKRVAVLPQTFTGDEKAQARTNIGALDASVIGDPNRDLVAVFNAALV